MIFFFTEIEVLNFWFRWNAYGAIAKTVTCSGVWWKTYVSSPVTVEARNTSPSCAQRVRNFSVEPIRFVL